MTVRVGVCLLVIAIAIAGCAGPSSPPASSTGRGGPAAAPTVKRMTAGILGDPHTLSQSINAAGTGSIRGVSESEKIYAAGLSIKDWDGRLQPQLAESVPSLENGGWRLQSDGRMETTWKVRANAKWHDGTPVTAADLVFTLQAGMDKDLPLTAYTGYSSIDGIDVVDTSTITVRWKVPYIEADQLFTHEFALPMPKHLLEPTYLADKSTLVSLPYWTTEYVGAGPFKLRDFVRNSHMVLEAFDGYVLGRPKIDQLQIKFIQDPNALIANVLAGEVDMTIGRGFNLEQLLTTATQWPAGRMESSPSNWIAHYPQALTPNPAVLGDVRFRRGLMWALDRQAMSDALQAGQAPVAHSWVEYGDGKYKATESSLVKYDYDLRRAAAAFEEVGLTKGPDGFYRDATGRKIVLESRTNAGDDLKDKMLFSSADYWKRAGIDIEPVIVPRQQATDREYRATFPGFDLVRQPFDPLRLLSSQSPLPENRFNGNNRTRYQSAELDSYINGYLTTIPERQRYEFLGKLVHHMSDQVVAMGIFYGPEPKLFSNRILNVKAGQAPYGDETWNAHSWDLK